MSNEKAPAEAFTLYNRFMEYARVVSKVVVTSEGVFKQGETPDDYGGAKLEIDVVHAVQVVNGRGEMLIFEFDAPEAMDKERKVGGPVVRDGEQIVEQSGESSVATEQKTVVSARLSAEHTAAGDMAKAVFEQDLNATPNVPKGI